MTTYIMAIDPGLLTGASIVKMTSTEESPVALETVELIPKSFAPWVRMWLDELMRVQMEQGDRFVVVCERFVINAATAKKTQAPWSLEQIGILKQCLRDRGLDEEDIVLQNPADAMKMFTNDSLRKVGVWHKGGDGHANDSLRHALLYSARNGWVPRVLIGE